MLDQSTAILDGEATLLSNFRRLNPEANDNAAHAALARFLFRNEAALKPAGSAAGSACARPWLAC